MLLGGLRVWLGKHALADTGGVCMAECTNPSKYGRCRKCTACMEWRKNAWVLRMHLESMLFPPSQVTTLTLTYKNEDLPSSDKEAKQQFQKFMKRLRKDLNIQVRYFAALEKGSQTHRYHWHVIFFGITVCWQNKQYVSKKWGHGYVRRWEPIRSSAGIAYAAKYALKDRCYLMSRVPPLGHDMIERINKTIKGLSRMEVNKLIANKDDFYLLHQALKIPDHRFFTLSALRLGGYYYPLHDYLRKKLIKFGG